MTDDASNDQPFLSGWKAGLEYQDQLVPPPKNPTEF